MRQKLVDARRLLESVEEQRSQVARLRRSIPAMARRRSSRPVLGGDRSSWSWRSSITPRMSRAQTE